MVAVTGLRPQSPQPLRTSESPAVKTISNQGCKAQKGGTIKRVAQCRNLRVFDPSCEKKANDIMSNPPVLQGAAVGPGPAGR